ncbi:MAG: cytochrome c oxidase accessory protein CcoG [Verrucomicrobia bacterium]|nr:cytochrome c oxidase accessory protein CcoG [Verrucomicrobiota bacterium]
MEPPPHDPHAAAQEVNWEDFRDHLTTADKQGHRRWLYPKKPSGRWYRWRTAVSWLLLAVLFAGPFIRIDGNPLLLLNIVERRFSIFGQIFWPQDAVIFSVAMLLFLTSIIIFTTAFGRLWCGWTCPQTLLMEMVFRKIEYAIEGDAVEQRALRQAPWTTGKILKKAAKHVIFFGLSFVIGNTLLSYIIGSEPLFRITTDNPLEHLTGLAFMILFTLVFYAIFARFREQACTFICPYGRFQSTMIDENTMVVAYDHKRGERHGHLHRDQTHEERQASGLGDCIDCRQCVAVCPTGIDIRNGTQMECVNCTACIDACDAVMDKIRRPLGLIRYASLNSIERGEPFKFTSRLASYLVVICGLAAVLAVLVFTRADTQTTLLRTPGALFQRTPDGKIANLYALKVINKTTRDLPIELRLESTEGKVRVMGAEKFVVLKEKLAQTSVLIELDPSVLRGGNAKLKIGVYSEGKLIETVDTVFVGPRSSSG